MSVTYRTFELWMAQVNRLIANKLGGMTSDDLPDWCYRDAFDQGNTANYAANCAIRQAREF